MEVKIACMRVTSSSADILDDILVKPDMSCESEAEKGTETETETEEGLRKETTAIH